MSIDILLEINGKSSNVGGRRRKSPFPCWNDIPNHQRRRHSCLIKHSERSLRRRRNGAYAGAHPSAPQYVRAYAAIHGASTQNYSQARRINTARIVRALRRLDKQTPSAVVRRAADLVWLIVSRLIALSLSLLLVDCDAKAAFALKQSSSCQKPSHSALLLACASERRLWYVYDAMRVCVYICKHWR
jgi:hypothetical protein